MRTNLPCPDGRHLYNHATTAVGYASSREPLVRFGLGTQPAAVLVEAQWPSGRHQKLTNVAANRILEVIEDGQP